MKPIKCSLCVLEAVADPGFCFCCILAKGHGTKMKLMGDDIGVKYYVSIKKNLRSEFAKKNGF
jgi:hypothetical protein